MAIFSPLRRRRLAKDVYEEKQQLIVFPLGGEYFGLPIDIVKRVIPITSIYGDPQGKGISLTSYEGKELVIMDVGKWIFHYSLEHQSTSTDRFFLILTLDYETSIALPISETPTVRSIPITKIKELSDVYLQSGNIDCVSSLIINEKDEPPIFLLDRQKLLATSIKFTIQYVSP
jgi:purine-binding chemotaxis protein CheW